MPHHTTPRPNARTPRLTANQRAFLAAFAELGNVSQAAERASVDRTRHYDWLRQSEPYAEAFTSVSEQFADRVEAEARRRAVEGWDEPVYQGGACVGTVRKFSDRLLELMLKAKRPAAYRERVDHTTDGKPMSFQVVMYGGAPGCNGSPA